ncbi:hypothetical protein [Pseudooceanicola sp. LIPI14-2-Ac024]|uniref:hypothetical protein n=1 Tax=Pseudooceanicola sp. LIPI14-2-Ac024 TaxID=3344875 RepID=UPI0035CFF609
MSLLSPQDIHRLRGVIAAADEEARIQRVTLDGAVYWVKREEKLSLRWRLQKGDGARALERERTAYHELGGRELPIAELVDEGPDYLVTRSAGAPLSVLLADPDTDAAAKSTMLVAAAEALHRLHAVGVAHGRPSPRDMMWDGAQVTFIDFERFGKTRNLGRARAVDVILFAFGCLDILGAPDPAIDAGLARYRALDTGGAWDRAVRLLSRLRWIAPLALRIPGLRDGRDIRTGAMVFDAILRDGAARAA